MRTLIKNGLILTLDTDGRVLEGSDVLVEGERIAGIGTDLVASGDSVDRVIDGSGKLVMPGMVNAHIHSYDAFMKGLYEDLPLEVWFPYASLVLRRPLTQGEIYVRTQLVASELLRSGVTAAYDDVTLVPLDEESVGTVMTAYSESGIRAIVGASVLNKSFSETMPFLNEIMPQDVRDRVNTEPRPDAELLQICQWMIEEWNGKGGHLHVALAPSAPQRCTDDFMLAVDDLSSRFKVPWNTHVLETKVQAVTGPEFYGMSIVEHLAELGLLSERAGIIHGVWLKDRDIELLADGRASVVHNPVSNAKIRSGIARVRDLLDAGVNVALGSDNSGAVDTLNMFEMMKFAALLPQVAGPGFDEWKPALAALTMATAGGAGAVMLRDEIGTLEVGKRADMVLIDLETQPFTPLNDPVRQLVYGESGQSVTTVMVNGELVLENGKMLTIDEAAVLEEAREIGRARQDEDDTVREQSASIRPYLEQMYNRAVAMDVGINRFSD
jgi:5-methylthioadenosine/S-adenosylhomocysteine deaminase